MSKINTDVKNLSDLIPTTEFGQATPVKVGSTESWMGKSPKGERGWTDKSQACLGLLSDTKVIWSPVYFDSIYDYATFGAFAHANGLTPDVLGARLVRQWFEDNRSQVEEEAAAYSTEAITEESLDAKLAAAERQIARINAMKAQLAAKPADAK